MQKILVLVFMLAPNVGWGMLVGKTQQPLAAFSQPIGGDPLFAFAPGDSFEIKRKLKNHYFVEGNNGRTGFVPGGPFMNIQDGKSVANTAPVFLRSPTGAASLFASPGAKNPLCTLQDGSVMRSVGPVPGQLRWSQVNLKNHPECSESVGFIESQYLSEEYYDNWTGREYIGSGVDRDPPEKTEAVASDCVDCEEDRSPRSSGIDQTKEASSQILDKLTAPKGTMARAVQVAMKNRLPGSSKYCYRFVKDALKEAGVVDYKLGGKYAREADPHLRKAGMINLMDKPNHGIKSPYDAPPNSLLLYAGDEGHIEFKVGPRGKGGVVSDYYSPRVRTGTNKNSLSGDNRTLIGVYELS